MTEKCFTNKHQFKKMLEILNERRDIAMGIPTTNKEDVNQFWNYISDELNALGPPIKDSSGWRKIWIDFKYNLKKKFVKKKAAVAGNDSPKELTRSLTYLEEFALEITGMLEFSTNKITKTNGKNSKNVRQEPKAIVDSVISNQSDFFIEHQIDDESHHENLFKDSYLPKCNKLILDTASDNVSNNEELITIPPKLKSRVKTKKCKKRSSKDDDLLDFVKSFVKQEQEYDEIDYITKVWALKLKKLPEKEKIIAEKAINDILFEAEMGTLKT